MEHMGNPIHFSKRGSRNEKTRVTTVRLASLHQLDPRTQRASCAASRPKGVYQGLQQSTVEKGWVW